LEVNLGWISDRLTHHLYPIDTLLYTKYLGIIKK